MVQVLPQVQTLATLDPHSLHMELTKESKKTLVDSVKFKSDSSAFELYSHEAKHFSDIIGTLWGQDYLDLLFAAYDSLLIKPGSEKNYPVALSLFDADRAILFPSYYKYVMPNALHGSASDRWSMGFSSGVRIKTDGHADENDPLLFVRFDKGANHVARQPVTVGSLLEMRALGAEIGAFSVWNRTRPNDERIINENLRHKQIVDYLYDPSMTTYSVASHVAGRLLNRSDVIIAMDAGHKISDMALNLTGNLFNKITHPENLFSELSRQRLRAFKSQRHRGYAYTVLLWQLRNIKFDDLVTEDAIEETLRRCGLNSIDRNLEAAVAQVERKKNIPIHDSDLRAARHRLIDAGLLILARRRNYSALSLFPPSAYEPSPLVITGEDCEEFHLGLPALSINQTHLLHDCYATLRDVTRQALRAARGFEFNWSDYVY